MTDIIQIAYASQPFGYDSATLNGILLDARRCNTRDGITGALVCRQDIYLQLIEGPLPEIEVTFDRICRDDRHLEIRKLIHRPAPHRIFGEWAMLHDPATSCIWTQSELSQGALDRASPDEVGDLFEGLAKDARRGSAG